MTDPSSPTVRVDLLTRTLADRTRNPIADFTPDVDDTCWRCTAAPIDHSNDDALCHSCSVSITRRYP